MPNRLALKPFEALAADLKKYFPYTQGFSRCNLYSMKRFAEVYPTIEIVQALPGQSPRAYNLVLLELVKDSHARRWYA